MPMPSWQDAFHLTCSAAARPLPQGLRNLCACVISAVRSPNAHAVLARPCSLNLLSLRFTSTAKAANRVSSWQFTLANAHVVLARCCSLNLHSRRSTAIARAANRISSEALCVTTGSFMHARCISCIKLPGVLRSWPISHAQTAALYVTTLHHTHQ
jgi:hypothetical protein